MPNSSATTRGEIGTRTPEASASSSHATSSISVHANWSTWPPPQNASSYHARASRSRGTARIDHANAISATAPATTAALTPKRSVPAPSSLTPTNGDAKSPRTTASAAPRPNTARPPLNTGPSMIGM